MYFISRNNRLYHHIAHVKQIYRYLFTGAVLCLFVVSCYFLQQLIDTRDVLYAQELKSLRTLYSDSKKIEQSNDQLSILLNNSKKDSKAVDVQKNSHEFFKQRLLFVLERARQSSLTIQSYGAHKEKNAQWYIKEVAHINLSGSLGNIMAFLEGIQNSKKMISISRWSLSHENDVLYAFSCDIGFVCME